MDGGLLVQQCHLGVFLGGRGGGILTVNLACVKIFDHAHLLNMLHLFQLTHIAIIKKFIMESV